MSDDFRQVSYEKHQQYYQTTEHHGAEQYRDWFKKPTADFWRHRRKLAFIDPLLENDNGASWLCLGDGRYGSSTMYLQWKGAKALATDINDLLLKVAVEEKLIEKAEVQNAESLTYPDKSFDYALCKESFHHFPRPYIAVYEMLRVSRKAIILIEPKDWIPLPLPLRYFRAFKNGIKRMIGKEVHDLEKFNYEDVGNYIYMLSEREFQKIALGLDLPMVAFKSFDDVYYPGVENEPDNDSSPLFRKIKSDLQKMKWLRAIGMNGYNYSVTIVFLEKPNSQTLKEMQEKGYRIMELPRNPHLSH